jgi:RNA polymerase sigma-70 factor (ECF subfamily)
VSTLSQDEIERIVAAALTGDRAAESQMLRALRPGVLSVLRYGAFHRWIDAEDLTQETLHIVVERVRARTIDDPRKVFAFAAATARNLALNAARKMLRQQTEQSDLSDSDDRHLAQAVVALLEELPAERDRQLLVRFYLDGTDKQVLCRELGLSPKHFDRVLLRARTRLRAIIERRAPHLALVPRITAILLPVGISFTFLGESFWLLVTQLTQ